MIHESLLSYSFIFIFTFCSTQNRTLRFYPIISSCITRLPNSVFGIRVRISVVPGLCLIVCDISVTFCLALVAMQHDQYLICEYCNNLFPIQSPTGTRHDRYPNGCSEIQNSDDEEIVACWTCDSNTNRITNAQKSKYGWKARCVVCVNDGVQDRFKRYNVKELAGKTQVSLLEAAVSAANISETKKVLNDGADPNGKRQLWDWETVNGKRGLQPIWKSDRSIYPIPTDQDEPDTPLKLVFFRVSDCLLEDDDLDRFVIIAKLLAAAGADQAEAIAYAKNRYGDGVWMKHKHEPFWSRYPESGIQVD